MFVTETDRLIISKLRVDDASFYLRLVNTPKWLQFIGDRGIKTLGDAEDKIQTTIVSGYEANGYGAYKLQLKEDPLKIVGSCGLYKRDYLDHPDIGFALLPEYEGNGYGYESSIEVLKLAKRQFNQKRILAIASPANQASINLLQKLGLEYEKTVIPFEDGEELLLFAKPL